jgi:hypothetical protein
MAVIDEATLRDVLAAAFLRATNEDLVEALRDRAPLEKCRDAELLLLELARRIERLAELEAAEVARAAAPVVPAPPPQEDPDEAVFNELAALLGLTDEDGEWDTDNIIAAVKALKDAAPQGWETHGYEAKKS